ncbi:hypothetical protein BSKO_12684 [Bryopsis sp. KO-2023]|nr:hypothetical protein BSKO_12684 [Bryopsis sp. KO-2023]
MPVSGRPNRTPSSSEPLVTEWLLAEISDVSRSSSASGFVHEHLRLLQRELSSRHRDWSLGPLHGLIPPLLDPGQPDSIQNQSPPPLLAGSAPGPTFLGTGPCPYGPYSYSMERETTPGTTSDGEAAIRDIEMEDYAAPHSCSFLTAGREFRGVQRCTKDSRVHAVANDAGDWKVSVQIQCYEPEAGYICGIMEANVSPDSPVVTFWEGEIVDNENFTFMTNKWQANQATDLDNWSKFRPFQQLKNAVLKKGGQCGQLTEYPYVFMRWKEKFFVSQQENSQLTIQGFYYVCMSRQDGHIWGYYYDPDSQPHQELELNARSRCHHGFGFAEYELR